MTGLDLVSASLRLIGALGSGETAEAADASDALSALNRMIGSWSTDGLLIVGQTREEFTLTPNTGSYTMGSAGTFNTTRPQQILSALIRDETSTPATEQPVNVLSLSEYASITAKDTTSTYPNSLYDDGAYPLRTLKLYPVPSAAHKLVLYSLKAISEISSLSTTLSFPPGYEEALVYNLAVRLAPEYGKTAQDSVLLIAQDSKAGLKRANQRSSFLRADDALLSGGGFNIYTGDSS